MSDRPQPPQPCSVEVRGGALPAPAAPRGWRWCLSLALAPLFLVVFMLEIFWGSLDVELHQWGWMLYWWGAATVNGWVFRYLVRTSLAGLRSSRR